MPRPRHLFLKTRCLAAPCLAAVCIAGLICGVGCPSKDDATGGKVEGGVVSAAPPTIDLSPSKVEDPIAALRPAQEQRTGWCVQIRSVAERAEADALVARIEDDTGQAATTFRADIDGKGTWWRICVGAESSRRQAVRRAAAWTSKKGILRKFMDRPKRGQARYFIKERTAASDRSPTEAQARWLLAARPTEQRRVLLATRGAGSSEYLGAVTTPPEGPDGRTNVLLVQPSGNRISVPLAPPAGCTTCRAAVKESPVVSVEALLVTTFQRAKDGEEKGEVIVLQAETEAGDQFLVLMQPSPAKVVGGIWIGRDRPRLRLDSQVERIQADTDPERELAVVRNELPVVGDGICTLRTEVDIYDDGPSGVRRLDDAYLLSDPKIDRVRAVATLTSALDRLGDSRSASLICRAAVLKAKDPEVTRHCMRRVSALLDRDDPVGAVNAAGLLAEIDEELRPAVAAPLFKAAAALDQHPDLVLTASDCARRPLVPTASSRSLDENLRLAESAIASQLDLADVVDAVFVTGRRDFGRGTPVGILTEAWLTRYKKTLPGRHAAIEALLASAPAEQP